jgi:hypothetical protein
MGKHRRQADGPARHVDGGRLHRSDLLLAERFADEV